MSVLELGRLRVRRSAKQPKAERVFGRGGLVYVGIVVTMVAQHSVAGTVARAAPCELALGPGVGVLEFTSRRLRRRCRAKN